MWIVALFNIYPAVTEIGYECEMSFTDASNVMGTFSQLLCWFNRDLKSWVICERNSLISFWTEFSDQIALFFGLILLSSPKPSIVYVKVTRVFFILSTVESVSRFIYYSLVFAKGVQFLRASTSCAFDVAPTSEDTAKIESEALRELIYEMLNIIFYSAFIWGTFALVSVLRRGGTGDERISGESDVLSIVKQNPPKMLVMSSAFGIISLRPGAILMSLVTLGVSVFHAFNNIYRMIYWCGDFDYEKTWCTWPFGVLTCLDQFLCIGLCLFTTYLLVLMDAKTRFSSLTKWLMYIILSSLGFLISAILIVSDHYPSYWMNGMRNDIWIYYSRFWLGATNLIITHSIAIVRLAGGRGSEHEGAARALIYANLSEEDSEGRFEESDTDSIADLFGAAPVEKKKSRAPKKVEAADEDDNISSAASSLINTPRGYDISMSNQAVNGLQIGSRVPSQRLN